MVHARLVFWGPCQTILWHGAMYHIVKFYAATWETICIVDLRYSSGFFVFCAVVRPREIFLPAPLHGAHFKSTTARGKLGRVQSS